MITRTCIACRNVCNKKELLRLVVKGGSVVVDETGSEKGRGAYLHPKLECWNKSMNKKLLISRFKIKESSEKQLNLSELELIVKDIIKNSN